MCPKTHLQVGKHDRYWPTIKTLEFGHFFSATERSPTGGPATEMPREFFKISAELATRVVTRLGELGRSERFNVERQSHQVSIAY